MLLKEYLFMAEANGMDNLVDTRDAKINAIIKDLKNYIRQGTDINDIKLQESVCKKHGMQLENLTQAEIRRIERALH